MTSSPRMNTRIALFDLAQRGRSHGTAPQDLDDAGNQPRLVVSHAAMKVVGTDQRAQGEVSFERRARRADADRPTGSYLLSQVLAGLRGGDRMPIQHRLENALWAVDELIAKSAAVAEEVAVHLVVVAVDDAAQRPIALAGIGVAAESAVYTDRRSKLLVPFAGVVVFQSLIGENAGGADFDQVSAELVLEDTIFVTAEEDRIPRGESVRDRFRPRSRDSSARSGNTGCTGSSPDSPADPGSDCETCAYRIHNGDSRDPS